MANSFKAHIFGRSRRGDREEVFLKFFNPDGTEADLSGGGADVAGPGEWTDIAPSTGGLSNSGNARWRINGDVVELVGTLFFTGSFPSSSVAEVVAANEWELPELPSEDRTVVVGTQNGNLGVFLRLDTTGRLRLLTPSTYGINSVEIYLTGVRIPVS